MLDGSTACKTQNIQLLRYDLLPYVLQMPIYVRQEDVHLYLVEESFSENSLQNYFNHSGVNNDRQLTKTTPI